MKFHSSFVCEAHYRSSTLDFYKKKNNNNNQQLYPQLLTNQKKDEIINILIMKG